jgi:hypothetical protein
MSAVDTPAKLKKVSGKIQILFPPALELASACLCLALQTTIMLTCLGRLLQPT